LVLSVVVQSMAVRKARCRLVSGKYRVRTIIRLVWVLKLAALAMIAGPSSAWSWGGDGHRIIGAIADIIFEHHPIARDRVKQILDGANLSEASFWMDCAKGWTYCHRDLTDDERDYAGNNPNHRTYHYTDVPIQQLEYRLGSAGTRSDDVVQIARYAIQVLRGNTPVNGPARLSQRQALWVLAHLVGDLHQPLHVGAAYFDPDCRKK
jgi:hypothetical protein